MTPGSSPSLPSPDGAPDCAPRGFYATEFKTAVQRCTGCEPASHTAKTFSGICRIDYEFLRFITHSSRLRKYILIQRILADHAARSFGWFGNTCLFESLFVREPKLHARRQSQSLRRVSGHRRLDMQVYSQGPFCHQRFT
jgi:hypothetical protein